MKFSKSYYLIIILFTLLSQSLLYSLPNNNKTIKFNRIQWKVIFTSLNVADKSKNITAIQKIPKTLVNYLQYVKEHKLSEKEIEKLREETIQKDLISIYSQLKNNFKEKSKVALSDKTKIKPLNIKIKKNFSDIKKIQKTNLSKIFIPTTLKTTFKIVNTENQTSILSTMFKEDADLVIYGKTRSLRMFDELTILCYNRWTNKVTNVWQGVISSKNLMEKVTQIRNNLITLITNRPWTGLDIKLTGYKDKIPYIYLDHEFVGINKALVIGIQPKKEHLLEIFGEDIKGVQQKIVLKPLKVKKITIPIILKTNKSYITIKSNPAGANVFFGAQNIGITPLKIQKPDFTKLLAVTYPGYESINIKLTPNSKKLSYSFKLQKSKSITLLKQVDKERRIFYWTSAIFTITSVIPMIAWGIYEKDAALANANNRPGIIDENISKNYQKQADIAYGVMIGGFAVAGVTLGVAIWRLIRYIQVSEKSMYLYQDQNKEKTNKDKKNIKKAKNDEKVKNS